MDLMNGKVVLITGSTDGIGKATALELARRGATVLLHGRNLQKAEAVLHDLRRITGSDRLHFYLADFSSLDQVRRLAAQVQEEHDRLHLLINNAGTFEPKRKITEDGLETTFSVNYLAPFLLTCDMLDLLKASEPSRIINVASIAHWNGAMDWDNLQGEKSYQGFAAYVLSKLSLILFTYSLAERLQGTSVTANCLHPGVIKTKLLRAGFGDYPGDTPERGARTSVYLASSPEVEGISGQYFEECKAVCSSPVSYDQKLKEKLWRISKELSGLDKI
ncbi:MAG TPA: SDR family oxidoreductase [Methanothrix sp.]|nr:SDR family oxidoreductase [Methanothrix sp.]